ncbi:serine/threonine phosphatase [Alkalinema sp. FACHB-956]|uniref:serine/threonine phosphatase n=1 Tax=Alkalinema sp. FACHB-956 TaxID=2692768 RepID=UPI0016861BD5|nr:serine/threonine phosphatase [Alkalinema sp. FACHB-956]MBD2328346.1 serine/threonine phosphatase [Alkalinema sp. FACHB-956]
MAPDPQNLQPGNSNNPAQNLPIVDIALTEAVTQIEVWEDSDAATDEADDMPTIVLPMHLSNLDDAAKTDVGLQREHNEDYYGIAAEIQQVKKPSGGSVQAQGIYILCDGMGGHAGGEVASQLAVETLQNFFQDYWRSQRASNATSAKLPPSQVIREGVLLANQVIFDRNQAEERIGSARMGTTLVMAIVSNTTVAVAHVGDSRLYRYTRKHGLEQITCDHEVGQREIKRGVLPEIAYARPDAYQLTQALGPRDDEFVEPDIQFIEINEDTLFLLASDGLTDNQLLEEYHKDYVAPLISSQANLDQGVRELISLANEYNGHDNITAIVIRAKVRPNLESIRF